MVRKTYTPEQIISKLEVNTKIASNVTRYRFIVRLLVQLADSDIGRPLHLAVKASWEVV